MDENGHSTRRVNVDHYIGKVLDKYVLISSLGRGGMGLVFKAEQRRIKRFVAIKLLPPARMDEVSIKRLEREATAMGNLKHPHIATLFDFGMSDEKQPYLVMELIEGKSLKQVLKDSGLKLEPDRAVAILIQIAEAMEYAHVNGVIHRDLKPDNIMLSDDLHADYVKILDFGIAKSLDASTSLTKTGQMVGSPVYMSPEQCTGRSVPDHRSDVYSLGAMIYECLTGVIPLKGDTYLETVYRKTTDLPDPFPEHLSDCKPLEELVLRCLQADPAKRPQSMDEVKVELMRFASGRSGSFDGTRAAFDALQRLTASSDATSALATGTGLIPYTESKSFTHTSVSVVDVPKPGQADDAWRPSRHDLQLPLALTMASMFIVTVTAGSLMLALRTSFPGLNPHVAATSAPVQQGGIDDLMTRGPSSIGVPVPKQNSGTTAGAANSQPQSNQATDTEDRVQPVRTAPAPAKRKSTRTSPKSSRASQSGDADSSVPTNYSDTEVPYAPPRSSHPHSVQPSHTAPSYSSDSSSEVKRTKLGTKTKKFLRKLKSTIDQVIRD